jgi:hydroxymethylbilane synthase
VSPERVVRIGTRGSALALAQARLVAAALDAAGRAHETVTVETEGDRRAPDTAWGEGAFVSAIERALIQGGIDVAVHSAKDIPTDEEPTLRIPAYLERGDPLDALVVAHGADGSTIDTLPAGAVIGTDSPRRTGFLRGRRPDLVVRPLHGNVDTRLRRLDDGQVDALLLAAAGLSRLGRADRISQRIPAQVMPPAPGQGAIALQVRADDEDLLRLMAAIDHLPTRRAVEAEREFLRAAGGGCRAPIGALAEITPPEWRLLGGFATTDGRAVAIDQVSGSMEDMPEMARELAARLGGRRARLAGGRRVLVTRPADQGRRLAARLAEHGIEGLVVPAIEIELAPPGGQLDEVLNRLSDYDWVLVTSANGARAARLAAERLGVRLSTARWAGVGDATARTLRAAGALDVWRPSMATSEALASELPLDARDRALLIRGSMADEILPRRLRERQAEVVEVLAYATREAPAASRKALEEALARGDVDAVLFASPSAVRGLLALAGADLEVRVRDLPAICIGPTTAAAVRHAGLPLLAEVNTQGAGALAELVAELVRARPARVPA